MGLTENSQHFPSTTLMVALKIVRANNSKSTVWHKFQRTKNVTTQN